MLNICFWIAVLFEIISVVFAILKGKAAVLMSGFNSLSTDERKQYDLDKISKNMSNLFFICGLILVLGILLSLSVNKSFTTISLVISLVLIVLGIGISLKKLLSKCQK